MAATDPIHPIMLYLDNEWQEFSYSMYENDAAYKEKVDASGFSVPDEKALQSKAKKRFAVCMGCIYNSPRKKAFA